LRSGVPDDAIDDLKVNRAVSLAGTAEGARKGWLKRRRGQLVGAWMAKGRPADTMVIGRRKDASKFRSSLRHHVLSTPDPLWSISVNDGWLKQGIKEGRRFRIASSIKPSQLRVTRTLPNGEVVKTKTVFYRELKQLKKAGYMFKRKGAALYAVPSRKEIQQ